MKLEGKNLTFQYDKGERKILNHLHIVLESGERLGMAAPSGFGKTTCCKILSGYEQPDEGEVLLDGRPLKDYRPREAAQRIAYLPQSRSVPRITE